MAKKQKTAAGTDIQHVKQQNAQAAQGNAGQFGTEFASETVAGTDVQHVKKQNAQSQRNKK